MKPNCLFRLFAVVVCTTVVPTAVADDRAIAWKPIPDSIWKMSSDSQFAGQAAVCVNHDITIDHRKLADDKVRHTVWKRYRVLSDAGRAIADQRIGYALGGAKVRSLAGRVVYPDGREVAVGLDDTQTRERSIPGGDDLLETFLVMPGVSNDCVVDLWWETEPEAPIFGWRLQQDVTILSTTVTWYPMLVLPELGSDFFENLRILGEADQNSPQYVAFNLNSTAFDVNAIPARRDLEAYRFDFGVMPPLTVLPFSLPPNAQGTQLHIYYATSDDYHVYWASLSAQLPETVSDFLDNKKKLKAFAESRWDAESDPRELAKAITIWLRDSLAAFELMTPGEQRNVKAKNLRKATRILDRRIALEQNLPVLAYGLLRALGVDVRLAKALSRGHGLFIEKAKYWQFDRTLLALPTGPAANPTASLFFFDPGCRVCPFGQLPWTYENVSALISEEAQVIPVDDGSEIGLTFTRIDNEPIRSTGYSSARENAVRITSNLVLSGDGSARGTFEYQLNGQNGSFSRAVYAGVSEPQIAEFLVTRFDTIWPGVDVSEPTITNLTSPEQPLTVSGNVETRDPLLSDIAGREVIDPSPLLRPWSNPFVLPDRSEPVIYPFAFEQFETAVVTLDADHEFEMIQLDTSVVTAVGSFHLRIAAGGSTLTLQRKITLSLPVIPAEYYQDLQAIFAHPLYFAQMAIPVQRINPSQ